MYVFWINFFHPISCFICLALLKILRWSCLWIETITLGMFHRNSKELFKKCFCVLGCYRHDILKKSKSLEIRIDTMINSLFICWISLSEKTRKYSVWVVSLSILINWIAISQYYELTFYVLLRLYKKKYLKKINVKRKNGRIEGS